MSNKTKHSATPWALHPDVDRAIVSIEDPRLSLLGMDVEGYAIVFDRPNAEHIVRCVNAHDDLLAACVEFVRKVEAGEARSTRSYQQMKAAIKKATK